MLRAHGTASRSWRCSGVVFWVVTLCQASSLECTDFGSACGLAQVTESAPWPLDLPRRAAWLLQGPVQRTLLIRAVERDDRPGIRRLVEARASVSGRGAGRWTPLMHAAARAPSPGPLEELVQLGAPLEETNAIGDTALHVAVRDSRVGHVSTLITLRANVMALSSDNSTALMLAAALPGDQGPYIGAALLAAAPAAIDAVNREGKSALRIAIESGSEWQFAALLLEAGAALFKPPQELRESSEAFKRYSTVYDMHTQKQASLYGEEVFLREQLKQLAAALRLLDGDVEDHAELLRLAAELQRDLDGVDTEAPGAVDAYKRLLPLVRTVTALAKTWTRCPALPPAAADSNVMVTNCECSFGWPCSCEVNCGGDVAPTAGQVGPRSCIKTERGYEWSERDLPTCFTAVCDPATIYDVPLHAAIDPAGCKSCPADGGTCGSCLSNCVSGFKTKIEALTCALKVPGSGSHCATRTTEVECTAALDAIRGDDDAFRRCCWIQRAPELDGEGNEAKEECLPESMQRDGDAVRTCTGGAAVPLFELEAPLCTAQGVDYAGLDQQLLSECNKFDNGDATKVEELLRLGADPSSNDFESPCLVLAARQGSVATMRTLIKNGAGLEEKTVTQRVTALYEAVVDQNMDSIGLLVKCGADVDVQANGMPLLTSIVMVGNKAAQIIRYLFENVKGIAVDAVNAQKKTAMHVAAARGDEVGRLVIVHLCEYGARKDLRDQDGKTAEDIVGCPGVGTPGGWAGSCLMTFASCKAG